MEECCIIFATAENAAQAEKISNALLTAHIVACVQQIPVSSAYWWKGKIENSPEVLLKMETRLALFDAVEKTIRANHTYEVPEIIATPIIAGGRDYLDWIINETKQK